MDKDISDFGKREWLIAALIVGVGIFAVAKAVEHHVPARDFAGDANCKVVRRISGNTGIGTGMNGHVTVVSIPGKTCWVCEDGIEECR